VPRPDRARVLLLWSGGLFDGGANFGVPQLLGIARALETQADAVVDVVDLDMERGLGGLDFAALAQQGYDLVGISCYSSYDYLKVMALGERLRSLLPRAWIVTGGYHASARPDDFTAAGSPFDFVVVGDGERSMVRLARALTSGKRPLMKIVGPESVEDPSALVPYRWELLDKYKKVARKVASQAEIYLSRGCPYDCAFCMERAKRDVSWRALDAASAVEEMHRLDAYLDLSNWTVFVADALFGMKRTWRRAFLEELARRPTRALRTWMLIRIDLIEREDIVLMAKANASPGFGLESGDPAQIRRIRKTGKLEGYLDKMMTIAEWCRELDVPFGANIIVGHPGETEQSLRTSAAYMKKLFLDPRGTKGFLSVDPFRLYPGSPIDEEREKWEADTGFFAHRYPWWHDGDQDFLSEWVDPSHELDFRRTLELKKELFDPIVVGIERNFSHHGPSREYFMRSVTQQVELAKPEQRLRTLALWHEWKRFSRRGKHGSRGPSLADDTALAEAARDSRRRTLRPALGVPRGDAIARALLDVPRERFVRLEDVARSAEDVALRLTDDNRSTVSALHSYDVAFRALGLRAGDALVDLGAGTGYGAALASRVVGETGRVTTVECVESLASRARELLQELVNVSVVCADAHDTASWAGASKVHCGFAVPELPRAWAEALAEGGILVVPVGSGARQVLTLFEKRGGDVVSKAIEPVHYVRDRTVALGGSAPPAARFATAPPA
jgi:protein-L-isoaspartate(D-aspartate) O-methyltransferase